MEQQQVLGMVLEQGKNIFFTGSAGESRNLPDMAYVVDTFASRYRKICPPSRDYRSPAQKVRQQGGLYRSHGLNRNGSM
jgi:hypothetical protein